MAFFRNLNQDSDVITDVATVTSGLFQDGDSSITTFYSSSTQYTNTGDYSIDVYRYDPANNASASVQFGVVYGHREGSGSLGTVGSTGDRTTAAIFGQFNNLINPAQTTSFKFQGRSESDQIYALVFNRARMRESIEPGGWEMHLKNGSNTIKLIDDYSTNKGGNTERRQFLPEYNVVSGTHVGGTTIDTAAGSEDTTMGSYGTFYPKLGVVILNPYRLSGSPLSLITVSGSNSDDRNNKLFFNAVVDGQYFQAKRQEQITSNHYFVRASAGDFNYTTNETFYTASVDGKKQIISGLRSDPKVYITTIGLYNSDSELLAVAKLSKPIIKSKSREALVKIKLDF
jgi:hypothetical protein